VAQWGVWKYGAPHVDHESQNLATSIEKWCSKTLPAPKMKLQHIDWMVIAINYEHQDAIPVFNYATTRHTKNSHD